MNKMKLYTIIGTGLFALTSITLFACSEIEDGSNDMSSWPEVKDYVTTLEHPCMLHTETDFEFVKGKVQSGAQPWKNAFDHLTRGGNNLSQSAYKASPVKLLARLDQNNWASKYPNDWNNYTKLMKDAAAAYQLALAKNVGEDLFIFDDGRALAMCEYVAKYNIGGAETGSSSASWKMTDFRYTDNDLPYTTYTNCSGSWDTISAQERREGKDSRGEVRPAWELVNRLAQDYGKSSIYAKMWVDKMRENASRGNSDGGAGDYGPNSGGYDQLGFGTLMFAKE